MKRFVIYFCMFLITTISTFFNYFFSCIIVMRLLLFPLVLVTSGLRLISYQILRVPLWIKLIISYLSLVILGYLYMIWFVILSFTVQIGIFIMLFLGLFSLNFMALKITENKLFKCFTYTLVRLGFLLVLRILYIFLFFIVGPVWVGFGLVLIFVVFHEKIGYILIEQSINFLKWCNISLICLSVVSLRIWIFGEISMEEVSIMPLMSGFPFMFTLSSVSNYSFSLFSRGLSTNAIKIPNLSIKDCNTYESNVVHALWSGNSKHLLQNMENLLKSNTWINTKSNINYVRSSHNNLGTRKVMIKWYMTTC